VFGFQSGMQKFLGFGLTYNWVKRSIFWKFLYWNTNLLCHNFDVIYIKKSVFENIFNTIMDVKWKTKNKIKARMDLSLFCHRKNMELVYDGSQTVKPKASFVLEKNTQLSTNGLRFCVFFYRHSCIMVTRNSNWSSKILWQGTGYTREIILSPLNVLP
jgi:hypothetical protein